MIAAADAVEQAEEHHQKGEFSQSVALLQEVVASDPLHSTAFCALGKSLKRMERLAEAHDALQKAVTIRPDFAEAQYQLGLVLGQLERVQDSLGCFFQAISCQAHFPEAHFNLGIGMSRLKKLPQAVFHFRQAIAQCGSFAEAHLHLAQTLEDQESWDEAMVSYQNFLEMVPDNHDIRNRLGILAARAQNFDEAMAHFQTVIRCKPEWPSVYHNMAVALSEQDRLTDALDYFDEAMRRNSDHCEAHKGKGMALLKLGRMPEGWAEYEWRLKCKDNSVPEFSQPMWDGSPLDGRTVLLCAEQGYGDSLQFIRYARVVKQAGGKVLFDCPKALVRLMETCPGIDQVCERGRALPAFDFYCPLLSVPHLARTSLETIPGEVPYFFADEGLKEKWQRELRSSSSFNIGVAWQGNPRQWDPFLRSADQRRSFPLILLEPLARLPGVKILSLQKGFGTEQIPDAAKRFPIIDLGGKLNDFTDTAAVMMNLDLVITADSSPAHLAGGLGIPVWVAIPFISCWRWLAKGEKSPWYPSMRLFRQSERGNWKEVFARMTANLRAELREKRRATTGTDSSVDSVLTNQLLRNELALAQQHFLAKRYSQAEEIARQILHREPDCADAWYEMGLAQQFQNELALAAESYRQLVRLKPEHVEGLTNLGIVLGRLGQRTEGEAFLRRAVDLRPEHAKAHNNLGVALAEVGKKEEALACWQQAVRLDPRYPEGLFNLAVGLADSGRIDEAASCYEQVVEFRPDHAEAYSNLGWMRVEQGRQEEAVVLLEHALRINPDFIDAYNNLGVALGDLGRRKTALKCFRESLRRRPMEAEVYNNMGTTLAALGRTAEAFTCFQLALKLKPDYPEVHWHQGLTYLQLGDMAHGWPKYEWRWKRKRAHPRRFPVPLWDGAPLDGKTILIWCEQGLGDAIQFIRYAPLVKQRGARVVVECPERLLALFLTCPGIDQLVAERTTLPSFDVHAPLMSLPGIFQTTLSTIPATVPYVTAESTRVEQWRNHLQADEVGESPPRVTIGIVWQGNPKHRWDRHRSFALEYFRALGQIKGVQLVSLQQNADTAQLADFARRFRLIDLGGCDLTDAAAVMQSLDLVISCDSALAHMAGALGVPVWVALSAMSDWRWLSPIREDSPWYPTMRLFRQRRLGHWGEVFERIAKALRNNIANCPAYRHRKKTGGAFQKRARELVRDEQIRKTCPVLIDETEDRALRHDRNIAARCGQT